MRSRIRFSVVVLLLAGVSLLAGVGAGSSSASPQKYGLWRDVSEGAIVVKGPRWIVPDRYRTLAADERGLRARLASAPLERSGAVPVELPLPLPDGTFGRFAVWESPVMAPALATRFPEIKTYIAQGLDDPSATARLDLTPAGFHAMVLSPSGTVYIDPYSRNDTTHYVSYYKRDYKRPAGKEFTELEDTQTRNEEPGTRNPTTPVGPILRTYRLAVAATGEYTAFHGGTVQAGMAAIVTSVNRVTGVYERDLAVRLTLVANNSAVVYTNPATDPYTNGNGGTMLGQNQTNLDAVIGNANYDIGHVFSTGGGGIAGLRVVCVTGNKARGVTGNSSPVGDPFDIDYVAHEMGHQFGGNHTFNGTTGSCAGNRSAANAYEPGSGSTIMAYAGICGAEDLQPHSDDDFHTRSFDEIVAYITTGNGSTCPAQTATGNAAPIVSAGSGYTIPNQTPFKLTGAASDPNGDPLTFDWEQFNLGTASPPNTDNGTRPIFRSFLAASSPSRTFPKLSDILNNTSTIGESLPTTNRILTFRMTARDNRAGGGGADYSSVNITVTTLSGPFAVTAPNTAVTWPALSTQSVTWNVANTNLVPVSCATINVLLSIDGGKSFPTTLAANTANDGAESITVPNSVTSSARVQVVCASNIFFDISNANFTISGGATATPTGTATGTPSATPTQERVLVGHVNWQGRPPQPHALQELGITLTLKSGATEVNYPSQSTDASGFFTVSISSLPKGLYNWRVKGPKYLANGGTVQLSFDDSYGDSKLLATRYSLLTTQVELGLMRAGDANDDNVANSVDFNIVRATFGLSSGQGGYDDRADFTGDQVVNSVDFNLLRGNFGVGGSPPIRPGRP